VNERYCLALAIASAGNSSPTLGSSSRNGAWHKATTCPGKENYRLALGTTLE